MCSGGGSGLPCPDPGVPCWEACKVDGTDCAVWEPIYWPEPTREPARLQAGPEPKRPLACGDCAYRPGSPERQANGGALPETFDPLRPFHCHDGMPALVGWTHTAVGDVCLLASSLPTMQDGFLIGSYDYRPHHVGGRGYQADGRPLVVCAGWAAHAARVMAEDTVPSYDEGPRRPSKVGSW